MDSSLLDTPYDHLTKLKITDAFWGNDCNKRLSEATIGLSQFWTYYGKECAHALHDGGRHIALRTHLDVVELVHDIREGHHRDTIKKSLQSKLAETHENEDELLDNSIDLAASLLLMCDCGSSSSHGFSGRAEVRWKAGLSLRGFLAIYFGQIPVLGHEKVKLERNFIGKNLERIAGIRIVWTDNLADHLRLIDDDTKVQVFHHASFLEYHRRSSESLFPPGLALETIQTLALLFPSTDGETKRWLSRFTEVDQRVAQCGRLKTDLRQIERFTFWRDRLVMLKQVFDEAQPRSLMQWWHDRRNGVQWYTFWVAVMVLGLTVFFGLVQSVEGALQVWASFHALDSAG
ncbi:hypothetical protein JX265_011542 [Neoarthrinium moseri]|uniref:Uncharacterized protein n=1 Tax=Neoarthrinium moseri TaxID=1658444 RepID=A0A9Q0AHH3_9PEZI|nr:uncharacterized protein JN550_011708 [Neoarthrinium moseri]KAI1848604.1 hypothetical protein JX266_005463 [Neoarthrinium moseri]KAI1856583.1 hypothetical protein JX265_011542 [Neoarthrinium moseri]KAI1860024.1 hypothetical protein JN550_011708 [Neoarthrinium moseri]